MHETRPPATSPPATPAGIAVPDRPALEGIEERWQEHWEREGTYLFDRSKERGDVYAIDTPPPTVSGSLHVGHVFSYTQTDIIARYRRMAGKEVFYPIGWDDNGLPTERRVQNHFGVRCDPTIAFDPDFSPPTTPFEPPVSISRPNFVQLCRLLTDEDERVFEALFRRMGLSVDWRQHYTTIGEHAQRVSQRGFLRMLGTSQAYRHEAPTLWDVDFQSSVAQAELEDRPTAGAYHEIRFRAADGAPVVVESTRPELLAACVALVAHPDDERYRHLIGTEVTTPLFGVEVPVRAHELADPEKGSGVAMVCTFGDLTDVTWWRDLALPTRTLIGRDGRLEPVTFGAAPFGSTDPEGAQRAYDGLVGASAKQARARVVELLRASGDLLGEPKPITHAVKYYERGERPLEIVSSRQWYVRTVDIADELLARGRAIRWHPEFMRMRYEAWVEGLTGDWNISRQRFFGVPFPVWYRVRDDGTVDDRDPLVAPEEALPVDPSVDVPPGFSASERNQPGGFAADPDVMDTWATSSLTPEIAGRWEEDPDLFHRVFPMDLRPQAHEIIRTWLFTTVVRSHVLHGDVPWSDTAISGWILDPDRKKMSKSVGNVIVPNELLETKSTDAVRYWAASARLGADTVFDDREIQVGRRLCIKILNASKFVLTRLDSSDPPRPAVLDPLDDAMLSALGRLVADATESMTDYDHARALELTERFFWTFCDDYLELAKNRTYRDDVGTASARYALRTALSVLLRLFAPVLPFTTEEVWSWWRSGSIHRSPWPSADECGKGTGDPAVLDDLAGVLGEVRRAKTMARRSMRAVAQRVTVTADEAHCARLRLGRQDLLDAGAIEELRLLPAAGRAIEVLVELGPA